MESHVLEMEPTNAIGCVLSVSALEQLDSSRSRPQLDALGLTSLRMRRDYFGIGANTAKMPA